MTGNRNQGRVLRCFALAAAIGLPGSGLAQDGVAPAKVVIETFRSGWNESAWEKPFRTIPGHIRPVGDDEWKLRFRSLQQVVKGGQESIPALLEALKSADTPRRIFAAQALRYLAPHVPSEPLLAANKDSDAAVRLYAADALGMKGDAALDLEALKASEKDRDVLKHLNYATERQGQPIDPATVRHLVDWNPATIDSAAVGSAAPDFELQAATGETVRLSSFRGKSSIVLVFIYGDT